MTWRPTKSSKSRIARRLAAVAALALLLGACAALAQGGARDPDEIARTWRAARVFLPVADGVERSTVGRLDRKRLAGLGPLPVVIYAHGCAGIGPATDDTGRYLARAGFLVIAPDSFARKDKPRSCDPARHRGGLHRAVLGWRQAEVDNAIRKARALPGVDPDNIFLMGFSEGAITVATYTGEPVRGRIIEGWTCHSGWPEYRGLNAPRNEPVLSLVGSNDPWFRQPWLQGACGAYMAGRTNARSIVFRPPSPLAKRHYLSSKPEARDAILGFLAANLKKP